MVNPWLGIVGVLVVMLALQGGLHFWRAAHPTHAELARKLIHISLGLITLSFPWLFDSVWPVVVVCLAIIAWLVGLRSSTMLRSHLGGAIHSVARRSLGEIYFPLSVVLLFVLSQGDPLLYCVPILILTLADTAAALVGAQYGSL